MKKKTILKMLGNLLLSVLLIIVTFWIIFKDQDMQELTQVVRSANYIYILIGILLMFLYYLSEANNIRSILQKLGEKISLIKALKFTWIGFFFSSITPAATGGQPVEIYYMKKEKISAADATMALLIEICGFHISTITLGIISAILNPSLLSGGLIWLFLLGLIINGFVLTIFLICVFSHKLAENLVLIAIKILKFFRIKNIYSKRDKIEAGINKYHESSAFIKTHKSEFIKAILRVFVQIIFYYLVPFCVYKSFGLNSHSIFELFTMQAVLFTTVSSLPLPGSIGVSETVFLAIFGAAFGKELLNGAMLLSRGITFYGYVIISLIVVIINAIKTRNIKKVDDAI